MSDTNKTIKPFCRYCDKTLSEEKGEIAHGCLDCHGMPWQERIDAMETKIQSLKQQLADAEKVIDEVISRSIYTYTNTQCKSAKERVIKIAKLCERYKSKYKVGDK